MTISDTRHHQPPPPIPVGTELRQWLETSATVLEHIPGPLCVVSPSPEAELVYHNAAFLALMVHDGHPPPPTGQGLAAAFPHSQRIATLLGKQTQTGRGAVFTRRLHGDESSPTYHITVQILQNPATEATLGALISFAEDNHGLRQQFDTEKQELLARIKQLSTNLTEKQGLLKTLLERSPFGIALLDRQRRVIQLNHAATRILGISESQATGIPCDRIFQCYDINGHCPVLEGHDSIDTRETACTLHHKGHLTLLRSAVIGRDHDEPIVLEAFVDISEIKVAQQAKEAAYRAKGEFFSKMSHELRTPLNAIIGYSEYLSNEAETVDAAELKQCINAIERGGIDLLHLVDQVLEIAKLTSGGMPTELLQVDLAGLLTELEPIVRPLAGKNGNRLEVRQAPDVTLMHTDRKHLHKILLNLLSNACKFTENGNITVDISNQSIEGGNGVRFEIRDTGIGMDDEESARVFEKFEQADNTTTRRFGGSGLGLAITKELCELLGGRITIKSAPGQGAAFIVWLPNRRETPTTS